MEDTADDIHSWSQFFKVFCSADTFLEPKYWIVQDFFKGFVDRLEEFKIFKVKIQFQKDIIIDMLKFRIFGNQSEFFEPKNWIGQNFSKGFVDRLANFEIFEVQIQKNILSDVLKSWGVGDLVHYFGWCWIAECNFSTK